MGALSDYLENKLVDHIFRARSFSAPSTLYWALFTSAPSDSGGGTECTGGSYARVSMTPSDTAFTNTQGTTSGASSGTGGTITNGEVVQFATPTAGWGTVIAVAIFDASSGGNMLIHGTLLGRTINISDDVKFPVGSFSFQIDN
jgi:hypothetical protein